MKQILILGATSAMAQSLAKIYAESGSHFWLLGRSHDRLEIVAKDLLVRGAGSVEFRAVSTFLEMKMVSEEIALSGKPLDLFIAAQGLLPSQELCEKAGDSVQTIFQVNTIELIDMCLLIANLFEKQGHGMCVVIGSVAGDRGRRSNYIYGSTKIALETFCEGLRQRLEPACQVLLVKPGPTDTPMTAHLQKNFLFSTPDRVAIDVVKAISNGSAVLYSPCYWRWIMMLIRCLPRGMVKRLKA